MHALFTSFKQFADRYPTGVFVLLIAIPVVTFNLQHIFGPKYLLHDDPHCYRYGLDNMFVWWHWKDKWSLTAFTEGFSWWMMAHYSPYVVRLLYTLIYLVGISISMFWVTRRIFNLPPVASYLAAVLPAIYPMQYQMVAGINLSYPLVGMFVALLSLIAGFCYLAKELHSWSLLITAAGLYAVSTRLMEQSVFLLTAFGFVYLMTSRHWKRKFFLLLPMVFAASSILYRMINKPRGAATPQDLPLNEIVWRTKAFIMLFSPIQGRIAFALSLTIILLMLGTYSFYKCPSTRNRIRVLPHFSWLPEKISLLIFPIFAMLWTIPSVLPFLTMSPWFSVRMLFVAGYGPWLLMAPGFVFSLSASFSFLGKQGKQNIIILFTVCLVFSAGVQHMLFAMKRYETGNYYWHGISQAISYHGFPEGSEIVITNASIGSPHTTYPYCSGYLTRILGNRVDIGGLIGPEFYFYDPFTQDKLWLRPMTGIKNINHLYLYRWVSKQNVHESRQTGILDPYEYFLRVFTDQSEKQGHLKSGDWFLYQLNKNNQAHLIHSGHGLTTYETLLKELKKNNITPNRILWGNPANKFGINSPELKMKK